MLNFEQGFKKAFPEGQKSDPAVPRFDGHTLFSPILKKFFVSFFSMLFFVTCTLLNSFYLECWRKMKENESIRQVYPKT